MRNLSFLAIFLFCFQILVGQALPPIENFGISDYGAGSQNWAISQDDNNHIYVGNNKGLLEYNGSAWKLYPSYNSTIIRSVKVIENKVYTGFYMDFGYWGKDSNGAFKFHSLVKDLKLELIEDCLLYTSDAADDL